MLVNVVISIPSSHPFTYGVPEEMEKQTAIGKRVLVPFGRRNTIGYIVELNPSMEIKSVKDILEVLDTEPLFSEQDLDFYRWTSQYYLYPLGKTLKMSLPGGIDAKSHRWVYPSDKKRPEKMELSITQSRIMEILADYPQGLSIDNLKKVTQKKDILNELKELQDLSLINLKDRIEKAAVKKKEGFLIKHLPLPRQDIKITEKQKNVYAFLEKHGESDIASLRVQFKNIGATLKTMKYKGLIDISTQEVYRTRAPIAHIGEKNREIQLNKQQKKVLDQISEGIRSCQYFPCLLHGVTGSGKTEVYLKAIEEALAMGQSAIYLVPEITLTPQLMSRIHGRFNGDIIATIHSKIGRGAKYDEWRRISRGDARIVIGARSAIFAPAKDLGLIIVDEEHDTSYKQEDHIPYNARDLAIVRAKKLGATVILGSATPGIQTYFNTKNRDFRLLEMPERVAGRDLPAIEIVDMKQEATGGSPPVFSKGLIEAIKKNLAAQKQTLVFLNRRGFDAFLCCLDCGHIFKCLNCSVSLTHHRNEGLLKCHYCNFQVKSPPLCPSCGGARVHSYGVGTEKVQEEMVKLFPDARVGRMDSDAVSTRGSYEKILISLDRGEIDILVGTQMITKGHDFPGVTLVGVISADTSLNMPDFRAAEKTFQLLTQVSGRGGRGDSPGKVIIQTLNPENLTIRMARDHDYLRFWNDEISIRQELGYPPFSRLVNLTISSTNETSLTGYVRTVSVAAKEAAALMGGNISILGPVEAPLYKIKGRYRWQMLLKGTDISSLHGLTKQLLNNFNFPGMRIKADVDPVNFM